MLETGQKAPEFEAVNQDGEIVKLSDYQGKNIVLYFYPKDNTSGCTTEACEFRDSHTEFEDLNAVVLGVSKDSEKSHFRFREKFNLPFHLLADTDLDIHHKYGTWVEKKMYGKTYMGTSRTTFVIDKAGIITNIFTKVKPAGHAEEVKKSLKEM